MRHDPSPHLSEPTLPESRSGEQMPLWFENLKRVTPALILFLLVVALLAFGASFWHPRAFFLSVGAAALVTVVWPIKGMRHADELMSPWGLVIGVVVVGLFARGLYVMVGRPDLETIDTLFLLGQDVGFFVIPSLLLLVGLALVAVGFFETTHLRVVARRRAARDGLRPTKINRFFSRVTQLDSRRVHAVVAFLAVLSFLAFLQYLLMTGGLESEDISTKRAVSPGLDIPEEFRGHHYLRFVADLGGLAYLTLLAFYGVRGYRLLPWRGFVLAGLFVNACLLPFYASSRSGVLTLILLTPAVLYYSGRRIKGRHVVTGLVVILVIMQIMTVLRQDSRRAQEEQASSVAPVDFVDTMIMNRNLLDVFKTAHVINNVPEVLDYKYGETIYRWALGVIPRELWPGKPGLTPGPEVGILVYGARKAGVPPGFVGELYWNFHLPGVVVGSLLFGLGLRLLHERFTPRSSRNVGLIVLYSYAIMRSGLLIGTAVGQGMFNAALGMVAVMIVLVLLAPTERSARRGRAALPPVSPGSPVA